MLSQLRNRWRPVRRRLAQNLGLGSHSRAGLERRLEAAEREIASLLRRLHPSLAGNGSAPAGFRDHEAKLFSQNGEDGLLLHIFDVIGTTDRRLVEFGIEDGRECLARTLVAGFGWSALLMDSEPANVEDARRFYSGVEGGRVRIERCHVTAENIDDVLAANGCTGAIDLLAIDIDGCDYWVWKAITVLDPRVVAIEYNASFGPEEALVVPYDPAFDRKQKHASGWYHGASIAALAALGRRLGYALVGGDSAGVNAFFVKRSLLRPPLEETAPAAAWCPHRSRTRKASPAAQLALLQALPLVRNP